MSLQLLDDSKRMSFDLPLQNNKCFKRKVALQYRGTEPDFFEDLNSWLYNVETCRIFVHMATVNNPDDGSPTTEFVLSAGLFLQLQCFLSVYDDLGPLKLTLSLFVYSDKDDEVADVAGLVLTDFTRIQTYKDDDLCFKYTCRDNTFNILDVNPSRYFIEMQLTVDTSGYIGLSDLISRCDPMIRAIFADRKYCDFELVSKNGHGVACHKDFLRVNSSVLKATIDGQFVEGQQGKLVMQDATGATVDAFLEFVYCNSVKKACKFSNVAFELLKAADYYDMELLWKVMVRIMNAKPLEWYLVEVALELFEFAVKKVDRDGIKDLKEKALNVLARNIMALDELPLSLEMFPTMPSREMFKSMLEREAFRATVKK